MDGAGRWGSGPGTSWPRRVLCGDDDRPSRAHTARGQLIPRESWRFLPGVLANRFRDAPAEETPWMVPAAVAHLDQSIRRDWTVLELGSGRSTPWLARRAARVVSLESEPAWVARTQARLRALGIENCALHLVEIHRFTTFVGALDDESFDLVVVDNSEGQGCDRVDCVRACGAKVRLGGLLTLDDSDRPHCHVVDTLLQTWPRERFVGLKSRPLVASETTVYRRPLSA